MGVFLCMRLYGACARARQDGAGSREPEGQVTETLSGIERERVAADMDQMLRHASPDLRKLARSSGEKRRTTAGNGGAMLVCETCGTVLGHEDQGIKQRRVSNVNPAGTLFHRSDDPYDWCGPLVSTDRPEGALIPPKGENGKVWKEAIENAARLARDVAKRYAPDLEVRRGKEGRGPLYLQRWWLERSQTANGGEFGLYIHRFLHDDDAGLHDHPWPSASLLLSGILHEKLEGRERTIRAGSTVLRSPGLRHRLVLERDGSGAAIPAQTLIATGAREKSWALEHEDGEIEILGTPEQSHAKRTTIHKCST